MTNVLVELIEINDEFLSNYIIHVDSSFTPEDLQKYLNHIKNNTEFYTFYINKEVFKMTLDFVMEKHKLNSETKILIEFETERNKFNEEFDLKNQISFIKTDRIRNIIYIGFYNSTLKCFDRNSVSKFDTGNEKYLTNVRVMCSNEMHRIGYVKNLGLVDFNSFFVISDKLEIVSLFVYENKVLYGTQDGKCYVYENGAHKLLGEISDNEILTIYEQNKILYFCSRNGNVLKLAGDFVDYEKKNFFITCAETYKDSVFYGTSSNVLYKQSVNNLVSYKSEIRFIDYIRILNENTVIIGVNILYK
ncbi:hypothetical protein P3W45_001187 [Vairimorpha bombi]